MFNDNTARKADESSIKVDFNSKDMKKYLANASFVSSIGYTKEDFIVNEHTTIAPHLLIGGMACSGKSYFLRQQLLSVISWYTNKDVRIFLVDLKNGLEFSLFKNAPHVNPIFSKKMAKEIKPLATNVSEVLELFQTLNEELDHRISIIKKANVTNINEMNFREHNLPYIMLAIDEFAEIQDKEVVNELSRLLKLGKSGGIYITIASQKVESLPANCRANIVATVALRTKNTIESKIILDNRLVADIPPIPGRGIYQIAKNIEIQVPFITTAEVKQIIKQRKKELEGNKEE